MSMLWHNGQFKADDEAVLSAADRALRGHGVFDTMLVVDGKLCFSTQHFTRLTGDMKMMGLEGAITVERLEEVALELLRKNEQRSGRHAINTLITGGLGARGLTPPDNPAPQIIMRSAALPESFPPIAAIISQTTRRNEGSPLSRIKSINYGDNILALNEARAAGGNEAIMLNNAGKVTCSAIGNVFAAIDGTLYTPPLSDGAMAGVTRELLLEHHGAQEKSLTPEDLQTAQGLYISNSLRGLATVTSLNGAPCANAASNIPKDFHAQT